MSYNPNDTMLPGIVSQLRGSYLVPAVLSLLGIYLVTSYILAWRRLRHFAGPPLASFSYLWLALQVNKRRQGAIMYEVIKKYGSPLVRIGPNDLVTDSPDIVRRMSGARSAYVRSSWYRALKLDPTGDSMISTLDTATHDRYKTKVSLGYAGKENPALEDSIDEQIASMVDLIRRKYISDDSRGVFKPLDLATTLQYFTLDAITCIAYGNCFGFLATDSDVHDYIKILEETVYTIVLTAEVPQLQAIFLSKWFLRLFGPKPTDKKGIGKIMGVARRVVAQRFGPGSEKKSQQQDMLGSFVRHGLTQEECEQEVMLQIAAGSDTTAAALRGTLLLLCSTPHVYYRLQREIDDAAAAGKISDPIKIEEAKTLPYLQAVIYEGLRLNQPFTGLLMKEVPPGGDTVDGRFIPGGVRIATSIRGVQMRRDVFGQDVEMFRPERWLEESGVTTEQRSRMAITVELLFGYGRWMCAGKPVAFIELNKVYVELLRRFDLQVVDPKKPWREDNLHLQFQSDLWVKVTERKKQ